MLTSLEPFISAQDEVAAEEEKKIKKKKRKKKGPIQNAPLKMQYLPLSHPQRN